VGGYAASDGEARPAHQREAAQLFPERRLSRRRPRGRCI
jgi:hypothetical protein